MAIRRMMACRARSNLSRNLFSSRRRAAFSRRRVAASSSLLRWRSLRSRAGVGVFNAKLRRRDDVADDVVDDTPPTLALASWSHSLPLLDASDDDTIGDESMLTCDTGEECLLDALVGVVAGAFLGVGVAALADCLGVEVVDGGGGGDADERARTRARAAVMALWASIPVISVGEPGKSVLAAACKLPVVVDRPGMPAAAVVWVVLHNSCAAAMF